MQLIAKVCLFSILWNHHALFVTVPDQCSLAFTGNLCSQIYEAMNVYTILCLIFINGIPIIPPTKLCPNEPGQFWLDTNFDPHK